MGRGQLWVTEQGLKVPSMAELIDHVLQITERGDAEEAAQFLTDYTDSLGPYRGAEAERVARSNIGYVTGEMKPEVGARARELFGCPHPILGMAPADLTPEQAFNAGVEWATGWAEK